jgi:glutamate 5-kinase
VVPIVNENDTVMVAEIELGDNDNLSALVSAVAEADLLLILTDTEGVMDCDPTENSDACLIPCIEEITDDIRSVACGTSSGVGRGGMSSKIEAAEKAARYGVPTIITRGKQPNVVRRALSGGQCGTLVLPAKTKMSARKHWIRYNLVPEGTLTVDDGAARAMIQRRTSLLPVGVTAVEGSFEHGSAVTVKDLAGNIVAVGLVSYSSEELKKIVGRQAAEIEWILGYSRNDDVIHADNLVLWAGENGR